MTFDQQEIAFMLCLFFGKYLAGDSAVVALSFIGYRDWENTGFVRAPRRSCLLE